MEQTLPNIQPLKKVRRGRRSISEMGRILSIRHEEILKHLGEGRRYAEIAGMLFISIETVRTHAGQIYKRLSVNNKTDAYNKYFGKTG